MQVSAAVPNPEPVHLKPLAEIRQDRLDDAQPIGKRLRHQTEDGRDQEGDGASRPRLRMTGDGGMEDREGSRLGGMLRYQDQEERYRINRAVVGSLGNLVEMGHFTRPYYQRGVLLLSVVCFRSAPKADSSRACSPRSHWAGAVAVAYGQTACDVLRFVYTSLHQKAMRYAMSGIARPTGAA